MVLFATFRVKQNEVPEYQIDDQYLPYHFIEDKTMPAEAVINLLSDWKSAEPWSNYVSTSQRAACMRLIKAKDKLKEGEAERLISVLRDE